VGRDCGLQELTHARAEALFGPVTRFACDVRAAQGFPFHVAVFFAAIPKIAVTALIVLAIVNLLIGVILRYFVGAITDHFDMDPVPFTWVRCR
jgi:hypothetical protein